MNQKEIVLTHSSSRIPHPFLSPDQEKEETSMAKGWVALALVGTWLGAAGAQGPQLPPPQASPGTEAGSLPGAAPSPRSDAGGLGMDNSPAPADSPPAYQGGPGLPGPGLDPACAPEVPCEAEGAPPPEGGEDCACRTYPRLYSIH